MKEHAPISPDSATETRWTKRTLTLIAGATFFRLVWLFLSPLDLVPDEAYYWDWGRQPDWCYFSKPPMIAWTNTLTQALGLTSTALVRLPAVIYGTAGLVAVWVLARKLWGERGGFIAAVLSTTAPGSIALNALLTIDAPLMASWAFALYALWRALEPTEEDNSRPRHIWWALFATAGIFGVLSKQMMLVLPALAVLFTATSTEDRAWLRRPSVCLWLASPLLAMIPVLSWNLRHDWITAQHTAHHFQGTADWNLAEALRLFLSYLGGLIGLIGPVSFAVFVVAASGWRRARNDRREWFLWIMSVPGLLFVATLSLRQNINANWPAAFQLPGILLAAGWLTREWPRRAKIWRAAWVTGISLAGTGYALAFAGSHLREHGLGKLDLTRRLRGWQELGETVGAEKARIEAEARESVAVVINGGRALASELAFYLPGQPRTWRWSPPGTVTSQYDIWEGPLPEWQGKKVLIVSTSAELPDGLVKGFQRVTPRKEMETAKRGAPPARIWLFVGEDLQDWNHGKPLSR